MKKHRILVAAFALCTFISIVILSLCAPLFQKPNNDILYSQAIKHTYSNKETDTLNKLFKEDNLPLYYFKLRYRPQCIRKTDSASEYAILLGEDGTRIFVFWNSETNNIYQISHLKNFFDYNDFSKAVVIGETSLDSVIELDSNFSNTSTKANISTGHILRDGVINVEYDSNTKIVKKLQYYSNDEIVDFSDDFPMVFIPYILPKDKL